MTTMAAKWVIAPKIPESKALDMSSYPPVLRQLLYNRGIEDDETALQYLGSHAPEWTNTTLILGIESAVARIIEAIKHRQKIIIFGDYDVDGVTSTALLFLFLKEQGAQVNGYIPDRFKEGYGLNIPAIERFHELQIDLIITVDCGIRSLEEVDYANNLGIDTIICDHHTTGPDLPQAVSIIDPKQPADHYPQKDLAAVGLVYKLVSAIGATLGLPPVEIEKYLDLVALGTVADMAPLTGENRFMVKAGLKYLQNPQRQGVMSLLGVSGLTPQSVSSSDIGFVLGPRINAVGRLESAMKAFELLTTTDIQKAGSLAQHLEVKNRERRQITLQIQLQAENLVLEEDPEAFIYIAAHEEFNPGVVGLAASRLVDRFYKPAIVGHQGEQYTRASCRSIPEFHITEALDCCSDLLVKHGGHAAAAGFTIQNDNWGEFLERIKTIAQEKLISMDLHPSLYADMEIPFELLDAQLIKQIKAIQPAGFGNATAQFVSQDIEVSHSRPVGKENAHLKLTLTDGWVTVDAIAFGQGHWIEKLPKRIDILYSFEINEFRGRKKFQLNIRDIKPTGKRS